MKKTYIYNLIFSFFIIFSSLFVSGYKYSPDKGKFISLAPSLTEIIYAIKAEKNLAAVTSWSNYPPQAKKKPSVGDALFINKEEIIKFKPEMIFALPEYKTNIDNLRYLGIKIYYFPSENINAVYSNILRMGEITGHKRDSLALVKNLKTKQKNIKYPVKKKKILFVVQAEPLITIGADSFITDLIRNSGNVSVTQNIKGSYNEISQEFIIANKPQIVYVYDKKTADYLAHRIKGKYVILTKHQIDVINRPGPRIIEAIKIFSSY